MSCAVDTGTVIGALGVMIAGAALFIERSMARRARVARVPERFVDILQASGVRRQGISRPVLVLSGIGRLHSAKEMHESLETIRSYAGPIASELDKLDDKDFKEFLRRVRTDLAFSSEHWQKLRDEYGI